MRYIIATVVLLGLMFWLATADAAGGHRLDGTIGEGGGAGVSWPLTAGGDLDMDGSNIDNTATITTADADPADGGALRLGNAETECWEANPTGGDLCLTLDANNRFVFDAGIESGGNISLASGDRLELNGVGGNMYITDSGGALRLFHTGASVLRSSGAIMELFGRFYFNTFSGAVAEVEFATRRGDTTPNDGDLLHELMVQGYDDAPTAHQTFVHWLYVQEDVTDGTEDASVELKVYSDGVMTSMIKADGNVPVVVLGAPHEYIGEMYQRDNSTATTVSVATTWYEVDNFSAGHLRGWTHATGDLTATNAGVYKCFGAVSYEAVGTNQDTEGALSVNDTIQDKCIFQRLIGTGTDVGNASINCILDLSASDVIKLEVRNNTSTGDITVAHANIMCVQG